MSDFKESDLYEPIRGYFTSLGYDVQAEVKSCDLVANKNGETVIAELKKSFCLKLVYQALERQSMTDLVFAVMPRPKKGAKGAQWNDMLRLMKKLNIGIMTVALDSPLKTVEVVSVPHISDDSKNSRKKNELNRELQSRNMRTTVGGVSRKKILTAYREKSIFVLCLLDILKEASPSEISRLTGIENAGYILSRNHYGWFKKVSKGVYSLDAGGREAIKNREFPEAFEYYSKKAEDLAGNIFEAENS